MKPPRTVEPDEIINDRTRDDYPPAPPPVSGYRDADITGVACWNCGHFTVTGTDEESQVPEGICELWECAAEGGSTCDRFTAHSDLLRQSPHTSWREDTNAEDQQNQERALRASIAPYDYSDQSALYEMSFAGEATEQDGLIWKKILRTGFWSHTPTKDGVVAKKLRIVRNGHCDRANGIIALSELEENFDDGAVPYVTVPLSDDDTDHKNIARLNTGFVRKLRIDDDGDKSYLCAGIDFTEPDIKEKVLRGTIPDVSAGIPFQVTRRKDNKTYAAVLDHVCLTRKPFVDDLSPFGIAAADEASMPVEAWEEDETVTPPETVEPKSSGEDSPPSPGESGSLSVRNLEAGIVSALGTLNLSSRDYSVVDIERNPNVAIISHRSGTQWRVPFKETGDGDNPVKLATVSNWKTIDDEESHQETVAASDDGLASARQLRELRLAQPIQETGEIHMSTLSLDGVTLSDEDRTRVQQIIDRNAELERGAREASVAARISELEGIGLKDRPGALVLYRSVMLSDDGGPAIILFSDDEAKKERLTAIEILDRFIIALKGDGGVLFSDQATRSFNDNKPAATAAGENTPDLEHRVEEAKTALYGRRKRTGRK